MSPLVLLAAIAGVALVVGARKKAPTPKQVEATCLFQAATSLGTKLSANPEGISDLLESLDSGDGYLINQNLIACLQASPQAANCQALLANTLYLDWAKMDQTGAADVANRLDTLGHTAEAACIRETFGVKP